MGICDVLIPLTASPSVEVQGNSAAALGNLSSKSAFPSFLTQAGADDLRARSGRLLGVQCCVGRARGRSSWLPRAVPREPGSDVPAYRDLDVGAAVGVGRCVERFVMVDETELTRLISPSLPFFASSLLRPSRTATIASTTPSPKTISLERMRRRHPRAPNPLLSLPHPPRHPPLHPLLVLFSRRRRCQRNRNDELGAQHVLRWGGRRRGRDHGSRKAGVGHSRRDV